MLNSVGRSFTVSRALVFLSAALGFFLIPAFREGASVPLSEHAPWFLSMWYQWDANWYMSIAQHGYQWVSGDQSNVAFFPLYPWAAKAVGLLLGRRYLLSGLLLSAGFLAAGLAFLYRLVRMDFGQDVARRTVWLVSIFPTAFFFSSFYTESLFLLTSVACFYYGRRGRWAAAGAFGLLASLTRIAGLLLIVPLAYEYLSKRSFSPLKSLRPALLWLTLVPGGLAVYMGYLYFGFGRPFAFAESQSAGWGHAMTPLLSSFTGDFHHLFAQSEWWVIWDVAATLLMAVCAVLAFRKLPASYALYTLASLLFPLAGGTMKSMSRYALVVFPVFVLLAMLAGRRRLYWVMSALSLGLLAVSTAVFASGRWIA